MKATMYLVILNVRYRIKNKTENIVTEVNVFRVQKRNSRFGNKADQDNFDIFYSFMLLLHCSDYYVLPIKSRSVKL